MSGELKRDGSSDPSAKQFRRIGYIVKIRKQKKNGCYESYRIRKSEDCAQNLSPCSIVPCQ